MDERGAKGAELPVACLSVNFHTPLVRWLLHKVCDTDIVIMVNVKVPIDAYSSRSIVAATLWYELACFGVVSNGDVQYCTVWSVHRVLYVP